MQFAPIQCGLLVADMTVEGRRIGNAASKKIFEALCHGGSGGLDGGLDSSASGSSVDDDDNDWLDSGMDEKSQEDVQIPVKKGRGRK
jgi:hypothetical protein